MQIIAICIPVSKQITKFSVAISNLVYILHEFRNYVYVCGFKVQKKFDIVCIKLHVYYNKFYLYFRCYKQRSSINHLNCIS